MSKSIESHNCLPACCNWGHNNKSHSPAANAALSTNTGAKETGIVTAFDADGLPADTVVNVALDILQIEASMDKKNDAHVNAGQTTFSTPNLNIPQLLRLEAAERQAV